MKVLFFIYNIIYLYNYYENKNLFIIYILPIYCKKVVNYMLFE